jgi:DNA replication and repair protein RecF
LFCTILFFHILCCMISKLFIAWFCGMSQKCIDLSKRTAIIGANGSGKTHILEAIHLASWGQLHYFHAPRDDAYHFELTVESTFWPKTYSHLRKQWRDEYSIQWGKLSSIKYRQDLPFRTVFLSPFDMNLLYFAPAQRRDYIDSLLARTFAQFPKVKREYETVMRQRNALLKKIRDHEALSSDLDYWDRTFAEKAKLYHTYRMSFVAFVDNQLSCIHSFLPKYSLKFSYQSKLRDVEDASIFTYEYLLSHRERDILTGHTHIGPHLDDFTFLLDARDFDQVPWEMDSREATLMLSRWETKVLLLALKQIEILFLRKQLNLPIVLLFDDVFAELDQNYAEHVIELFDVDQVVVTTQRSLPVSEKWEDFSCITLNLQ